jgi:hypothetical protein
MQIYRRIITDKNYTKGRQGKGIKFIVLHTMDGYGRNCFEHFNNPETGASANYGIWENGRVEQFVDDKDTAWANSNWQANLKSISIEFGDNNNPQDARRTDALYASGIELIANLIDKYLPNQWATVGTIRLHRHFDSGKSCPGGLDIGRICNGVNDLLAQRRGTPAGVVRKLKLQLQAEREVSEQLRSDVILTNQMNQNLKEEIVALSKQIEEIDTTRVNLRMVYADLFGDEFGLGDLTSAIVEQTVEGTGLLQRWADFIDKNVKSKIFQSILKYDVFVLIGALLSTPTVGFWLAHSGISDRISELLSPAFTISPLTITGLAVGVAAVLFKLLVTRYDTNKDGKLDLKDTIVLQAYASQP